MKWCEVMSSMCKNSESQCGNDKCTCKADQMLHDSRCTPDGSYSSCKYLFPRSKSKDSELLKIEDFLCAGK